MTASFPTIIASSIGFRPKGNGGRWDWDVDPIHRYDGILPEALATDDGAALVYHGTELAEVVSTTAGAGAYRVRQTALGVAEETPLEVRLIG